MVSDVERALVSVLDQGPVVVPTLRLPKFKLGGFNPTSVPLPLSVTVNALDVAELAILSSPVRLPVAVA